MNKNFTITKNDIQYNFRVCESLVDNSCVTGTGYLITLYLINLIDFYKCIFYFYI